MEPFIKVKKIRQRGWEYYFTLDLDKEILKRILTNLQAFPGVRKATYNPHDRIENSHHFTVDLRRWPFPPELALAKVIAQTIPGHERCWISGLTEYPEPYVRNRLGNLVRDKSSPRQPPPAQSNHPNRLHANWHFH